MPASSKAQQRFFGVVKAMQKGDIPKTGKAGKIAKTMDKDDVDKYASTKHKGKPEKVKREQRVRNLIKKMVGEEPAGPHLIKKKKIKEKKLNEAKPYETILKQLGGNRFIAMTGAKNLGTNGKDLSFSIGRNAKKVTHVHIKLTSMDLYDVEFINMRGAKRKVIKKVKGVYGDMLPKIFQKYTGMRTRLWLIWKI